jgi:hypothetical protein
MASSSAVGGGLASVDAAASTSSIVRQRAVDIEQVGATLDAVAVDLRRLWTSALAHGETSEVTRLVEAGHAVHDAIVALTADGFIAARSTAVGPVVRFIGRREPSSGR